MATPARREKDRWHQLADLIQDSNLPASDKSVFRFLLDRADYKSADLPAKFTPTRKTIARKTSLSYSQAGYSTHHLERHGWLIIAGRPGPGHPVRYTLTAGAGCDCTGRVHVAGVADQSATHPESATEQTTPDLRRWQRVADVAEVADFPARDHPASPPTPQVTVTLPTDDPRTLPTNAANAAGQVPLSTERQREEGGKREFERKSVTAGSRAPDWSLVRQLVRIVHADPCGGLHRDALAERLHLPARGRVLGDALGIAYRNKKIDFCGQYVVKPVPPMSALR